MEAYEAGALKSASILANGWALEESVEMAQANPGLGVGIHLTLVFGEPAAPRDKVPSLLFKGGEFARGYRNFIRRYFTGGVRLSEAEYEWERQIERVSRLRIDHIDSHQHLHLLPNLFRLTVKLAKKYGIPFIRAPYEDIWIGGRGRSFFPSRTINLYCRGMKRTAAENGLRTTDHFFGSSLRGGLLKQNWVKLMKAMPEGLTEIMCHPGCEDPELRRRYYRRSYWAEELEALVDTDLIDSARRAGISFTNFSSEAAVDQGYED